jgi:nucleoside-diphosphate-sugar epimerase
LRGYGGTRKVVFSSSVLFSQIRFALVVHILTLPAFELGTLTVYKAEQFRPLLHVRDVATATVDRLTGEATGVFNLAKQNVRIRDLAYQVRTHFPDVA